MSVAVVDTLNYDKVFRLMFNQLSNDKRNIDKDQTQRLSKEEIENIINKELPEIENIVRDLNKITESSLVLNRRIKLSLNKEINRVIITVMEKDTNKVIKQIPCEEIQSLAAHLKEAIGILYDKNV